MLEETIAIGIGLVAGCVVAALFVAHADGAAAKARRMAREALFREKEKSRT